MYQTIKIDQFSSGGLNTDVPQWALGPSFITDGINFRIKDNKIFSTYGYAQATTNAVTSNPSVGMVPSGDTATYPQYFAGSDGGILSVTLGSTIATSLSAAGTANWTFARLGPILIANSPNYGAAYKLNGAGAWTRLPFKSGANWGTNGKYGYCIRAHKTYLFMLGMNEGGTDLLDSFRWSHPADANAIPVTWDETDTAFVAGMAALGAKSKAIVDGLSLKESFIMYSQEAINVLYESGDGNIWNRNEITSSTGVLRKECIAELNGVHFLLCQDDIAICDGSALESIASGMIQRHMAANINSTWFSTYAFAVVHAQEREIWFCVPSTGVTTGCDLAYVYKVDGGAWSIRDIRGLSDVPMRCAAWGYYNDANSIYDRSIVAMSYGVNSTRSFNLDPVPPVNAYNHEYAGAITASNKDCTIERQNLKLGDLDQEVMITSVRPMLKGKGQVQVYIGSHKYAGANVVWKSPVTFDIRDDDRIPIRCSGKLFAWKIVGLSGAIFELSGIEFEVALAGNR